MPMFGWEKVEIKRKSTLRRPVARKRKWTPTPYEVAVALKDKGELTPEEVRALKRKARERYRKFYSVIK